MGASELSEVHRRGAIRFWSFDPLSWKPNYPNPAFLLMDGEDAFWAAKQVAAFSDAEIRALVETGEYSDPRAADWIAECLIKRRDKIAEAWYSKVLPLDRIQNLGWQARVRRSWARRAGSATTREYTVRWASWDEDGSTADCRTLAQQVPAFGGDTKYLAATIACTSAMPPAAILSQCTCASAKGAWRWSASTVDKPCCPSIPTMSTAGEMLSPGSASAGRHRPAMRPRARSAGPGSTQTRARIAGGIRR